MKQMTILPSHWAVVQRRRALAHMQAPCAFEAIFTTPDLFIRDAWDLWGDGLVLASRAQRLAALRKAVEECPNSLLCSRGVIEPLYGFIENALGSVRFDSFAGEPSCHSALQQDLLECVAIYEDTLRDGGLIDPGRAYQRLSSANVFLDHTKVVVEGMALTLSQRDFFRSQTQVDFCEEAADADFEALLGEHVALKLVCPAARYEELCLLCDSVRTRLPMGKTALLTKRPLEIFEGIAASLVDDGAHCFVRATRRFAETLVGRAFFRVFDIVHSEELRREAVSDYLANPASLVSPEQSHAFDAWIRGDRAIEKTTVLDALRSMSKTFECFEELACDPEADVLIGYLEDLLASSRQLEDSLSEEQAASLGVLRSVFSAARSFGLDAPACRDLLACATVDVSYETGEGPHEVLILEWKDAPSLTPSSWDTVFACDMANADWPARMGQGEILLEKCLGPDASGRACDPSLLFVSACAAASGALFIEWRRHDEDAIPLHPAAFVEELIRQRLGGERAFGSVVKSGACDEGDASDLGGREPKRLHDVLSLGLAPVPLDSWKEASSACDEDVFSGICLSPAQIETYASCPRKWFARHHLGLRDLEEPFDAAGEARFSREALALFYESFQDCEASKVTPELLPSARRIMRDTVASCMEAQRLCSPEDGRLMAVTEEERRRFAVIEDSLVSYLQAEAAMLPSFAPLYLDCAIPVGEKTRYAGFRLAGRIDRIDVDEAGRAVVIKYVNALAPEHNLYVSDAGDPLAVREAKLQAAIQAQIARRCLGLNVVGALYVACGKQGGVAGALDSGVDQEALFGAKSALCTLCSETAETFGEFLDDVERRVEEVLLGLKKGDVSSNPISPEACRHCFVVSCEKRRC